MEETKRLGLVVYLHSLRQLKTLRQYGTVYYFSKKMRYAVMYVDESTADESIAKLENLNFVKEVVKSKLNVLQAQLKVKNEVNDLEIVNEEEEQP